MIPTNLNCCTNRTVLKSAERKYNNKNNEVKADNSYANMSLFLSPSHPLVGCGASYLTLNTHGILCP